jgi:mannose-6-phosphate isomerase-like protein (cupin superfamily)
MSEQPAAATDPLGREFDRRPWGSYVVLEEAPGFKVKRLTVDPGQRLSYQRHSQRAEHWFIVAGTATVTLDGSVTEVPTGAAIDVPRGTAHRIENRGAEVVELIEVQQGPYLGEDDIERLDDDYGRVSS